MEQVLSENVSKTVTSLPNKVVAQVPKPGPASRLSSIEEDSGISIMPPYKRVAQLPRKLSEIHYFSGVQVAKSVILKPYPKVEQMQNPPPVVPYCNQDKLLTALMLILIGILLVMVLILLLLILQVKRE